MLMQVDNPVQFWVGELFQVSRDGLMEYVIKAYKRIYQQDYMKALEKDLRECPSQLNPETFASDKSLVAGVDLYCVLKLSIEHWDRLFQGTKLRKIPDRDYAQKLKDVRNAWAHQRLILPHDAFSAAQAAYQLLNKLPDNERFVQKISQIVESLAVLDQEAVPDIQVEDVVQNSIFVSASILEDVDFQVMDTEGQTERMKPLESADEFYIQVVLNDSQTRCERVSIQSNRFIIGRGAHSNIQIADPRVSRAHILLMPNGGDGFQIVDLHSANGTKLEDQGVLPNQPAHWKTGMSVMIGTTWLILRRGQA